MIVELPEWRPFTAGRAPWTPEASDRGRVIVALAPAATTRERWSADVALGIADVWGESGHRVVVADCVLEHPTLHRSAGLENGEGVSDAALFGASVSRVAQPVPGRSFFFVSAGSPTGDPETIVTSARWGRLQEGFRDAGVTFLVFLREGCAGESVLLDGADDIVVLTESSGRVPASAREAAGRVRVLVGPDSAPGADAVAPAPPSDASPFEAAASGTSEDEPDDVPDDSWSDPGLAGLGAWDAAVPDVSDADAPAHDAAMDFAAGPVDAEETAMDFAAAPVDADGADVRQAGPAGTQQPAPDRDEPHVYAPETEVADRPAAPPVGRRSRGRRGGADPDARRKLLWVGLVVLVLVVLVILGALR